MDDASNFDVVLKTAGDGKCWELASIALANIDVVSDWMYLYFEDHENSPGWALVLLDFCTLITTVVVIIYNFSKVPLFKRFIVTPCWKLLAVSNDCSNEFLWPCRMGTSMNTKWTDLGDAEVSHFSKILRENYFIGFLEDRLMLMCVLIIESANDRFNGWGIASFWIGIVSGLMRSWNVYRWTDKETYPWLFELPWAPCCSQGLLNRCILYVSSRITVGLFIGFVIVVSN